MSVPPWLWGRCDQHRHNQGAYFQIDPLANSELLTLPARSSSGCERSLRSTIWKIFLTLDNVFQVPVGAEILSVYERQGDVCLWMKVDPSAPRELRRFTLFGTSEELPRRTMTFLGTVHLPSGSLVFHVFERQRPLSIIEPGGRRVCGGP